MRSEDSKVPFERIQDYDIHREDELFAGSVSTDQCRADSGLTIYRRIVDDHYEHGLRLFQEERTGVIRLQASVQTGEVKRQVLSDSPGSHTLLIAAGLISRKTRKPIWTAFITHQIMSSIWMSRVSSRVVHLAELNRHVFTDEYIPQRTQTGAHELTFIHTRGMKLLSLTLPSFLRGGIQGKRMDRMLIDSTMRADADDFVANIKALVRDERARRRRGRSRSRSRSRGRQG